MGDAILEGLGLRHDREFELNPKDNEGEPMKDFKEICYEDDTMCVHK